MVRRPSALLAVFLVSGLSTWAGIAGASADPGSEGQAVGDPVVLAPSSVIALLAVAKPDSSRLDGASDDAWARRVDAQLDRLVAERRRSGVERHRVHDPRLAARVTAALARVDDHARVGVEVRDLETDQVLVSVDADRTYNPASNQKLITAIAAVELLGPDYQFETTVSRVGDSLILRGEGDPDLHLSDLHRLAAAVVAAGEFDGVRRVIVDDGAFDARTLGPGFRADGPGDSYIAPSGALAIDFATVQITVRPGSYRGPAEVSVEPHGAAIELRNRATTGSGSLAVQTRAGERGQTIVEIDGAIAAGRAPVTVRRRVHDPGLVAGSVFAELLAAQTESQALSVLRAPIPDNAWGVRARVIATHESAPLLAVLSSALRYSNNFTAEQVLRTLAWRASGRPGSWADGVAVLERFAAAVSPEAAPDQRFVNGSGLSHDGRLSPGFINDVLALVDRPSSAARALLASFAEAGGEGTLHYRLAYAGSRVLAKTGTYAGASSLSGIVNDDQGRRIGFSILINGGSLEANHGAQDEIVRALLR